MATMDVENSSGGMLVLWMEPLGVDYWLRPGERFRIHLPCPAGESPFGIVHWSDERDLAAGIANLTVTVEAGDCREVTVTDRAGTLLDCGHQRPEDH